MSVSYEKLLNYRSVSVVSCRLRRALNLLYLCPVSHPSHSNSELDQFVQPRKKNISGDILE